MNQSGSTPIVKHLVLLGGGHSHLAVLKHLGMYPVPGLAVTLITKDIHTPYSGSLPGYIAGVYQFDDIHIDLRKLALFAGARIIREEVTQLDLDKKCIVLADRPNINFDVLSINIGSKPDTSQIPGAEKYAIGIKPIDAFLQSWPEILKTAVSTITEQSKQFTLAIVGGGPASVELALAAQHRIMKEVGTENIKESRLAIKIISADVDILQSHNKKVRTYTRSLLRRRGISLVFRHTVTEFRANTVVCKLRDSIPANCIVYATGASIPQWPKECGLAVSEDGFISVNNHLQSISHPFVFAAGDAATVFGHSRPKSGVFAVRQGKPLSKNLRRYLTGRKLTTHIPQKNALALINTADGKAIGSRKKLFFHGRWVWRMKHRIDSKFVKKYSKLPEPFVPLKLAPGLIDDEAEEALQEHALRCAGCGAKVSSSVLGEMLETLPTPSHADILTSATRAEDAAIIRIESERLLLQSVDQIRAFIDDPWLFARIAVNHCLSDIYAMGAEPHSALAVVGLPFAAKNIMRDQLNELMAGCSMALQESNCSLLGGHSSESAEISLGLSVNGFCRPDQLLKKEGMRKGDVLILCKPLGTGTLFAADMRRQAKGRWIDAALQEMLLSNKLAATCFTKHGASSCTDITGFGLFGHLLEMIDTNSESLCTEIELSLADLPVLQGALHTLEQGNTSSLHADNAVHESVIVNHQRFSGDVRYQILFDPQTAGGLLASVAESEAADCITELRLSGYHQARIIGQVTSTGAQLPAVVLR